MSILVARLYICAFSNKKLLAHANVSRNKLFSNEIYKKTQLIPLYNISTCWSLLMPKPNAKQSQNMHGREG